MQYQTIVDNETPERKEYITRKHRFENLWPAPEDLSTIAKAIIDTPNVEIAKAVSDWIDLKITAPQNERKSYRDNSILLEQRFNTQWARELLIEKILFRSLIKLAASLNMTNEDIDTALERLKSHFFNMPPDSLPKTGADYMAQIILVLTNQEA